VPGVLAVGTASAGPLFGGGDGEAEFRRARGDESGVSLRWYDVGPSYFATLGVPLLDGRPFDETDRQGARPVAIVNHAAARMLGDNVVGTRLIRPDDDVALEIVGVVADVPPLEPGRPVPAEIYWPQLQRPRRATYFVVRTTAPVQPHLARALEQRAMEIEPDLRVLSVRSFDQLVDSRLIAPRFHAVLVGSFALLALVLATAGTYGVLAFSVSLRARDIGIRIALGAGRPHVIGSVMREGLALVGIGAAAGLLGSLWLTRLLGSLLHGVAPTDPFAVTGVIGFLGLIGIAACIVPAWRAGRVDPVTVMRIG
jgi:putative ABC transport system permease protein